MIDFITILSTLLMLLVILCMIETLCNTIFFSAGATFKNTNIQKLFKFVRKEARDGQKKVSFDGIVLFKKIKEFKIQDEAITIKNLTWKIWVPVCARTLIYKFLEYIEYILKMVGLKNAASVVHFVLQLFRIQCVYDLKTISKKDCITRILQIALNLGQLEGKLGIIFPFELGCFITANNIKINMAFASLLKNDLKYIDDLYKAYIH